jgi:ATP-dependent DNA helicase DinG
VHSPPTVIPAPMLCETMELEAAFDALPGLRVRGGQRAMARAVADAATSGEALLVHAPTGIGKSLGYPS